MLIEIRFRKAGFAIWKAGCPKSGSPYATDKGSDPYLDPKHILEAKQQIR
jgi:hypothetical protein